MDARVQTTNRIEGSRRWWVLTAVLVTMFFSSLDQTVVSTAMPVIISQLKGFSMYAWVFTAYMMASAVTVPIYGKLSDVYGRKPFYIFGLVVFMVGSAISGQAHSMGALITARAAQGVGAGAMMSMPRASIGDIFNPRERGRWMGLIVATFGLASIVGPSFGGWITDTFGWQWVFYVNLPVAAFALFLVWRFMPAVRTPQEARADYLGSLLLVAGLLPMLLGFTWAGTTYAWGSWQTIALLGGGVAIIAGFLLFEHRAPDPILNPELFRNAIFTNTMVLGVFVSMGMFGSLVFLPVFVQGVVGLSAAQSGLVLTPMMLSFVAGSVIGGQVMSRTGRYKALAVVGAVFMAAGMYLLTTMTVHTTYPTVIRNMLVLGLGVGAIMPLLTTVVQNAFPYRIMGMVNSSQQFVMSLGGVIAAPILGSVLSSTFLRELPLNLPPALRTALSHLPPRAQGALRDPQGLVTAQAQAAIQGEFSRFGAAGHALYAAFIHGIRLALTDGMHDLFVIALALALATCVGALLLREIPLKQNEFFEAFQQGESEPPTANEAMR